MNSRTMKRLSFSALLLRADSVIKNTSFAFSAVIIAEKTKDFFKTILRFSYDLRRAPDGRRYPISFAIVPGEQVTSVALSPSPTCFLTWLADTFVI